MKLVLIAYGSTMGNTKEIAEAVYSGLKSENASVVLTDVKDINPDDLLSYDIILLGSSTWGDGELQDDFVDFVKSMDSINLENKKAAVFGTGDTFYPLFCEAVEILETRLRDCGAEIICSSLKVDGDVSSYISAAVKMGEDIGKMIR